MATYRYRYYRPRKRRHAPTKGELAIAKWIRWARATLGLTQEQLGRRVGLKGRAIYRWERVGAMPSKRHERALIIAIQAVNPSVASTLADGLAKARALDGKVVAPQAVPSPVPVGATLDLAVFALAEQLDLSPRRLRGPLLAFIKRMRAGTITLEAAEKLLQSAIEAAEAALATSGPVASA
jgi:transcriptional regulator with XRE-family HTH domain